jgi:hypothetical protein
MLIVAFDPGGTTGVASYDDQEEEWARTQLIGYHHKELWEWLLNHDPQVIIYERFMYQRRELTKGVSLNLDAVEYIGVLKLWEKMSSPLSPQLICQTPHQAKKFWDDNKLKTLNLYMAGAPHANDATRHLLYYLSFTRGEKDWVKRLA